MFHVKRRRTELLRESLHALARVSPDGLPWTGLMSTCGRWRRGRQPVSARCGGRDWSRSRVPTFGALEGCVRACGLAPQRQGRTRWLLGRAAVVPRSTSTDEWACQSAAAPCRLPVGIAPATFVGRPDGAGTLLSVRVSCLVQMAVPCINMSGDADGRVATLRTIIARLLTMNLAYVTVRGVVVGGAHSIGWHSPHPPRLPQAPEDRGWSSC